MIEEIIHPSLPVLTTVLLVPFLPRRGGGWALLVGALASSLLAMELDPGDMTAAVLPGISPVVCEVDALSRLFMRILGLGSVLFVLYGAHEKGKRLHITVGIAIAGAYAVVLAPVYTMLVAGMAVIISASAFQIWFSEKEGASRAGFHFVVMNMVSWMFMWVGFAVRYSALSSVPETAGQAMLVEPMARNGMLIPEYMILAGASICTALAPAHTWLTDSLPETTSRGALIPGVLMPICGVYILARCFAGYPELGVIGLVTSIYGAAFALMAEDIRRCVGFAAISQCGVIVAGFGFGYAVSVNGASTLAYVHAIHMSVLLMVVGILAHVRKETRLSRLGGLVRQLPGLFLLYLVAGLSVAGLPLTGGFVSRVFMIHGTEASVGLGPALTMECAWLGVVLAVTIKVPYLVFYHKPEYRLPLKKAPLNMYLAAFAGALLIFFVGMHGSGIVALTPVGHSAPAYSPLITGEPITHFTPYTMWRILRVALTVLGLALGFAWWTEPLYPSRGRLVDLEDLYRRLGRLLLAVLARPAATVDGLFSHGYVGFAGALARGTAAGASWFERIGIEAPSFLAGRLVEMVLKRLGSPLAKGLAVACALAALAMAAWLTAGMLA